jgi:hypothetical protein
MVSRRLFAPLAEQVAAFAVLVGQGLAVVAAGNAGPDLGHLHERVPQPVGVDAEVCCGCGHDCLLFQFDFDKAHRPCSGIYHIVLDTERAAIGLARRHRDLTRATARLLEQHHAFGHRGDHVIMTVNMPTGFLTWREIEARDADALIIDQGCCGGRFALSWINSGK